MAFNYKINVYHVIYTWLINSSRINQCEVLVLNFALMGQYFNPPTQLNALSTIKVFMYLP